MSIILILCFPKNFFDYHQFPFGPFFSMLSVILQQSRCASKFCHEDDSCAFFSKIMKTPKKKPLPFNCPSSSTMQFPSWSSDRVVSLRISNPQRRRRKRVRCARLGSDSSNTDRRTHLQYTNTCSQNIVNYPSYKKISLHLNDSHS